MNQQVETETNKIPDLPRYVIFIVVWARMLYSGATSLGVLYGIAYFTQLPFLPYDALLIGDIHTFGVWLIVLVIVAFVVMASGFKLWVMLSWLTAMPFSADLRESFREFEE